MLFEPCLAFTLDEEGKLSLDEQDSGNWYGGRLCGTNLGISAPTMAEVLRERGLPCEPPDVEQAIQALTPGTASPIYRMRYWNAVQGDHLPAGVDLMVFDHGVPSGVHASVELLQRLLPVAMDGALGPMTLKAVLAAWPLDLIHDLAEAQDAAYRRTKNFDRYGHDWIARLGRRHARAMALHAAALRPLKGAAS